MLKTVLLLDASDAMNSSSDYLPSYLLAIRRPIYQFISAYLDSTPLASLGVVVMRDGISKSLISPTTNFMDIETVLERDYFLDEGSGTTSLVNGLRLALSDLVDVKKMLDVMAKRKAKGGSGGVGSSSNSLKVLKESNGAQRRRIVLFSSSVTVIDPTDIFHTLDVIAECNIKIDVVSFHGAVHVFETAATQTGGKLHCPLSYDHLLRLIPSLAMDNQIKNNLNSGRLKQNNKRNKIAGKKRTKEEEEEEDHQKPVPIGFPIYLPVEKEADTENEEKEKKEGNKKLKSDNPVMYLACPQCHLPQTAIPSTCRLCQCLICDVSSLYNTMIVHNNFVPAVKKLTGMPGANTEEVNNKAESVSCSPCHLCGTSPSPLQKTDFFQCSACLSVRCNNCNLFVKEKVGLCPVCVSLT